ncbi:WD repeat containing protein 20 [Fasciola hepatica]|uniref:WD repeat containing protein 20 n=1 Tax=Fasciola hepatica TaxID=6192 RepID=A0A4E0R8V3_FASHE|nr:WD repeat containing protein 20 [Fasciola hepatica]
MGDDAAPVNQFTFSPSGAYLALVNEGGLLRVLEYHAMELDGFMPSYFAGLVYVNWQPDSRFVVVGGQDDLVTLWSMQYRSVFAVLKATVHESVLFDSILTECNYTQQQNRARSEMNSYLCRRFSSVDDVDDKRTLGTYQIGSIGQDTLFCLWDVTEDVIRQGVQFFLTAAPTRLSNGVLDLTLRRNSTYAVCQQGLIRAWSRPVNLQEKLTSDSRLIFLAESAQNTQPTTSPPMGSGFFPPAIFSSVSAQSPLRSSSESSDCTGTDPFHVLGSTGRKTTESDECTKSQLPFTSHRLTTTTAALRAPPPTSSRKPNESGCIPTRLGLDQAYGSGTGPSIAGPRGLGHTPTASSSANV